MESWKITEKKLAYEWNVENFKKYEIERKDAYQPRKNKWRRVLVYLFFILAVLTESLLKFKIQSITCKICTRFTVN